MIEKRWLAVPPQLFVTNGTEAGTLTVSDSSLFKVKQQVTLASATQADLFLEIKRIINNTIYVGEITSKITQRTDISNFLVVDGAAIWAEEQNRSAVPVQEIPRAVFEEEPVCANRSILVDKFGNKFDSNNPFPVSSTPVPGMVPAGFGDVKIIYNAGGDPIRYSFYAKTILLGYITVGYDTNGNANNYQGYDALGNPL